MRTVLLLAVAATGVVLGGCGREGTALAHQDPDGTLCSPDTPHSAVYIEVTYEKGGVPTVTPDTCLVFANGKITWRGPSKVAQGFKIDFHSKDQAVMTALKTSGGMMKSAAAADRQKFTLTAWDSGTYTYDVSTAKGVSDPTIIIRPQ